MGLFSSLKNIVSGGGAEVKIENTQLKHNQQNKISVNVTTKDADVKADSIYFNSKCEYTGNTFTIKLADTNQDNVKDKIEISKHVMTNVLVEDNIELQNSCNLEKNKSYTFEKELSIKSNHPISHGNITWKGFAGISTFGNDPDSGWCDLNITNDDSKGTFNDTWHESVLDVSSGKVNLLNFSGTFSFILLTSDNTVFRSSEFGMIITNSTTISLMIKTTIKQFFATEITEQLKNLKNQLVTLSSSRFFNVLHSKFADSELNTMVKITDFAINELTVKEM